MKLSEIERRCEEIDSLRKQKADKEAEIQKLESRARKKKEEVQFLETIARLSGEKYEGKSGLEEVEIARKDVQNYQTEILKLEQEVLEGFEDVAFDFSVSALAGALPKIDERTSIRFEGNPCSNAVRFIASFLGSDIPLSIGNTELHPDKVVIIGAQNLGEVADRLEIFKSNISRLARIARQEEDPDVEEVADYFHESNYRNIWETIKGRQKITTSELYSELGLEEKKEKNRIRNFFINLNKNLKERNPFHRVSPGVFELNFFGSLVWKRYCGKYKKEEKEKLTEEASVEVRKERSDSDTLNRYLSDSKVKEIVYGKEVG